MDYSVVIPAYNEEELLPRTLASIRAAMATVLPYTGEIVVTDNNSTDRTAEVAAAHGARVVFEPINQISRARNAGAAAAQGRWLVFVDADTTIPPDLLACTLATLATGRVGAGGAYIGTSDPLPPKVRRTLGHWNWLAPRLHWAAGSYVYCTKEAWQGVGGFSLNVYASEELWFSRAVRRWGRRRGQTFEVIPIPVDTSMRKLAWFGTWRLFKQLCILLLFPFALRSRRLCSIWYQRPAPPKSG